MPSRIDSDNEEDEWELEYNRDESEGEGEEEKEKEKERKKENKHKSPSRRTRRTAAPARKIIKASKKFENLVIRVGSCVAVDTGNKDPDFALIEEIDESKDTEVLRAKLLWLASPEDVMKKKDLQEFSNENELFATNVVDWADMNSIMHVVKLLSKWDFENELNHGKISKKKNLPKKKKQTFFCCRAGDLRFKKLTKEFDLSEFYERDNNNNNEVMGIGLDKFFDCVKDGIKGLFSQKPKEPVTPRNKRTVNEVYGDDDEDSDSSGDNDSDYKGEVDDVEETMKKAAKKRKTSTSPSKSASKVRKSPSKSPSKIQGTTPKNTPSLPSRIVDLSPSKKLLSNYKQAQHGLHVAAVPDSLPCRENEYGQIYMALETAINGGMGSCIYISGIPGTGKTATVREVVTELRRQADKSRIPEFSFVEINGMKVINPQDSYELLYQHITNKRVAPASALRLLEKEFNTPSPRRTPIVVLMDELDQLVTRNQSVMYNFFNWPTLQHSRLVVVAVANTMDLPERTLSNKISSRLGLTRIQFAPYNAQQLKTIIESRLSKNPIVQDKAVAYASKALSRVGDARRALDICRRAVELAESEDTKVDIKHIQQANKEMTNSPMAEYISDLPTSSKVFLCAVLARLRRGGHGSACLKDVLRECKHLVTLNANAGNKGNHDISSDEMKSLLFNNTLRMNGFTDSLVELCEAGVLAQSGSKGEISASVQLAIGSEEIKFALKDDSDVRGML